MSCAGTSAPRRKLAAGGLAIRCAQSRGEWPGSRRTFLEGRLEGARVEVEREEIGGAREREGGARRVEAVEGGGRRVVESLGGARRVDAGVGGGGMSEGSGFRFAFELGGGGGCIVECGGFGAMSKWGGGLDSVSDVAFVV